MSKSHPSQIIGIILLTLFITSSVYADIAYDVIDLGTITTSASNASSISNNGQIVGGISSGLPSTWKAVLFDPTGGGQNILLGQLPYSRANSINDKEQIVGSSQYRATLFDYTGGWNNVDLGTLGGAISAAYSINNNGQIVGGAENSAGFTIATLFDLTDASNNINLGISPAGLPDGKRSEALSINNKGNGQIVGYYVNLSDNTRAILFDSTGAGNNIDLGTLVGFTGSCARSINDTGQIVGFSGDGINGQYWGQYNVYATLFDSTGVGNNVNLGTLNNYHDASLAYSINNNGQIVGTSALKLMSNYAFRATLFDPTGNGNNIDLNSLINPASGWNLMIATSINDNGRIVGEGLNPAGQEHAYLLMPVPEPGTIVLLGLGALILKIKIKKA
jgi:uncharacterized membrane protein